MKYFKKEDLRTGYVVELRSGQIGLIMLDNFYGEDAILFAKDNWTPLEKFSEDLIWYEEEGENRTAYVMSIDIMKVFKPVTPSRSLSNDVSEMNLLWERKEIPELTMEELIKKIGFEFKIKK